jgi:hypothetical protein
MPFDFQYHVKKAAEIDLSTSKSLALDRLAITAYIQHYLLYI